MTEPIEPSNPSDVEADLADLDYYRRRCHQLETAVTGARSVLSVVDDSPLPTAAVRCRRAADALRELLDTVEPDHSITRELRVVLDVLQDGGQS